MKLQLWAINSGLLIALLITLLCMALFSIKLPKKQSLTLSDYVPAALVTQPSIDMDTILRNDLFNTYHPPKTAAHTPPSAAAIPAAPAMHTAPIPKMPSRQFIEPLNITLAGIFAFSDESRNKAIILNNKTGDEKSFQVNDEIDDAQIITILNNRVVLIRSNGQQETLFLNQADATEMETRMKPNDWKHIVRSMGNHSFTVDVKKFVHVINSLGALLDMLDITTVYKNGASVGIKLGKLENSSLAQALGLDVGDVIVAINDIATTSIADNEKIFNTISALPPQAKVAVKLKRHGLPIHLTYTLTHFDSAIDYDALDKPQAEKKLKPIEDLESEKIKALKQTETFAPTYYDMMQKEKDAMYKQTRDRKNNPWLSKK